MFVEWALELRALRAGRQSRPIIRGHRVVTFAQLQQRVDQLSPAVRLELYRSCPSTHPRQTLLALETSFSSGVRVLPEMLGRVQR